MRKTLVLFSYNIGCYGAVKNEKVIFHGVVFLLW